MKIKIAAVAATALAVLLTPAVALADPHEGHGDAVRYASVKGCAAKSGEIKPCGEWRLVMHSGKKKLLKDAQVLARSASGKENPYQVAPIAVSGDGHHIAYFNKGGRLAVRTVGGGVKVFAKDALPRLDQGVVTLQLSDDGARLAAVIQGDKPKATRIFDTGSGALLGTVPKSDTFFSFSGDGDEVLTASDGEESTFDLNVYSDTGKKLLTATPPQIVVSNGPEALSADGRTTANLIMGAKPELVLYDMESDQVTGRMKVKLPGSADLYKIDWTGEAQVTLHLTTYPSGKPTKMTVLQVDITSGAVKVRDSYYLLPDTYTFAACGG